MKPTQPSQPSHPALPSSSVLDPGVIAELRELGGEDGSGLVVELIDLLIEDLHRRVPALHAAAHVGEWPAVVAEAHALKGASATMGAQAFSDACKTVELLARQGPVEPHHLQFLHVQHRVALDALKDLRTRLLDSIDSAASA